MSNEKPPKDTRVGLVCLVPVKGFHPGQPTLIRKSEYEDGKMFYDEYFERATWLDEPAPKKQPTKKETT